jgi:DNA (cytosine-5)-methyltransferase 1
VAARRVLAGRRAGRAGRRTAVAASMWPLRVPCRHLLELLDLGRAAPLSARATAGFLSRLERGRLRVAPEEFHLDANRHLEAVAGR